MAAGVAWGCVLIILKKKTMESKFEYIGNMSFGPESAIVKKQKSALKGIILIILGAVVLYFGATHTSSSSADIISSVLIIAGLIIVIWGIAAFFTKGERYYYKPTGKLMHKKKVYISPTYSSKLYQIVEEGNYAELKNVTRAPQSNLSIEALYTDDGAYALVQVMEFVPYNDIPMTPVKECQGEQARDLVAFLK